MNVLTATTNEHEAGRYPAFTWIVVSSIRNVAGGIARRLQSVDAERTPRPVGPTVLKQRISLVAFAESVSQACVADLAGFIHRDRVIERRSIRHINQAAMAIDVDQDGLMRSGERYVSEDWVGAVAERDQQATKRERRVEAEHSALPLLPACQKLLRFQGRDRTAVSTVAQDGRYVFEGYRVDVGASEAGKRVETWRLTLQAEQPEVSLDRVVGQRHVRLSQCFPTVPYTEQGSLAASGREEDRYVMKAWSVRVPMANGTSVTGLWTAPAEPPTSDWRFVYAPGAGSNVDDPFGAFAAAQLADHGIACLRFHFPYAEERRRLPDRNPVLEATWLAAIEAASAVGNRLAVGGRSMGGRIASQVAAGGAPVDALALFAYPLHPPGRPDRMRDRHLGQIEAPAFFCSGTSDAFATPDELRAAVARVRAATLHLMEGANHAFHVPKRSGRTRDEVWHEALQRFLDWLTAIR
ncbi:MAG: dienelactone hydrolase [Chloroflexi bacterium]|nr:dienelactone hydrolase [Chloroflexota bacterium]